MSEVFCGVHNEFLAVGVYLGFNKVWQRLAPHCLAIRQTLQRLRCQVSLSRRQSWAVAVALGATVYAAGGWYVATTDVGPNPTGAAIVLIAFYGLIAVFLGQCTWGLSRWGLRRVKG